MAVCIQAAHFNESSCLCQTISTYLILPALYAALFIVGLSGNLLSLWIFMTKISTKTPTHIYLINLGFSNLIMCLTVPFNAAYYALGSSWPASSLKCEFVINVLTPVLHINIEGGMLILTWLALSRFATLIQHNYGQRPSRCTKFLPRILLSRLQKAPFAIAMCIGTWAFVVAAIIPLVVLYSTMETDRMDNNSQRSCYGVPVEIGGSGSQMFTIVGITLFFLCLLLVMSAYISVIRHMKRTKNNSAISDRQKVYSKVCRNILVIQIVVVICLLPHHIYKAIFIAMVKNDSHSGDLSAKCHPFSMRIEVKNILLFLAVLRGSMDPLLYFLLDKTFKKFACGLFCKSFQTKEIQSSRTMNECGQLNKYDSAIEKPALKHSAPSYSKTEQTSNNQLTPIMDMHHTVPQRKTYL
ncbi:probable G-protein coupled receptor 82 isoform X1 [Silurus meridionalis]|uniref:probable G-protein coupled receptor 82 isoform X1 n=2 Tax=Silurus meridionalis TaxID=175797 RepID=UPI001EEB506B|nr:probable G-protein coupled receptor 82 isoform X1 [Silurus meridionalis]KAI5107105.1 G protein-coupled receptor 34a [Silurus meridionalis]